LVSPLLVVLGAPLCAQEVVLYEHVGFAGRSVRLDAAAGQLERGWNDSASSIRVAAGSWEVCRHADFRDCRVLDADVTDLRSIGWNDEITSLRPVDGAGVAAEAPAAGAPRARTGSVAAEPASSAAAPPASTTARAARSFAGQAAEVNGYVEYRRGDALVVEGQRIVAGPRTRVRGEGEAKSFASIPLGYQVEASGKRRADGAIVADRIDAKANGQQMFESDVRDATDQLEKTYRDRGEFLMAAGDQTKSLGKLRQSGPEVARVRRIVDRLLPPYIDPAGVRVYVIDNPEWNAMAMGNYSIYVFSGLLEDLDDDELAIVLGHEIAHASHEHTRKQYRRGLLVQLGAVGATVALGTQLEDTETQVAGVLAGLTAVAFANGYSRNHEDQADRVGMRYAYEAGYDVSKAPRLWQRFGEKYGEPGKAQNILFGDHSRSSLRARALDLEIAINYAIVP
jgi:Zn-dependent protease with chaperone function